MAFRDEDEAQAVAVLGSPDEAAERDRASDAFLRRANWQLLQFAAFVSRRIGERLAFDGSLIGCPGCGRMDLYLWSYRAVPLCVGCLAGTRATVH